MSAPPAEEVAALAHLAQSISDLASQGRRREAFELHFRAIVVAERLSPAVFETPLRKPLADAVSRLLAASADCLSRLDFQLTPAEFRRLMLFNAAWSVLRRAGDDKPVALMRGKWIASLRQHPKRLSLSERLLLLAVSQIEEIDDDLLHLLLALPRGYRCAAIMGFLANSFITTPEAEGVRGQLIAHCALLENASFDDRALDLAHVCWFGSSYAPSPAKHDIKAALNQAFARRFPAPAELAPSPAIGGRPVLLVMIERMRQGDVNFRCYFAAIDQLRGAFHTVLMAQPQDVDDVVCGAFDEVVTAPRDIAQAVEAAARVRASIVFYPTLGLRPWTIAAAASRLAPVQIISMGCPATSRSPAIDYVIHGHEIIAEPACFSERLIKLNSPALILSPHSEDDPAIWRTTGPEPVVRIAVRAMPRKLNHLFLDACQRIHAASPAGVEFQVFPDAKPFWTAEAARVFRERGLPAVMHRPYPYADYLRALARCDLALSPFPFGNALSTADALSVGVPVIACIGPEPHQRTDARLMSFAGLDEYVFDNVASYCAAAVRLIGSPHLREELSQSLKPFRARLYEEEKRDHAGEFAQALAWVARNHAVMQSRLDRAWGPRDWSEDLA